MAELIETQAGAPLPPPPPDLDPEALRTEQAPASELPIPKDRSLVNAFIIVIVVAIFFWSQPFSYQPRILINDITGGFMRFTGLWQSWDMFAPEPRSIQIRMDATVTLRDGTKLTWTFPQMDHLSLLERFRKERFRKWAHDNVRRDDESRLWEPTARYIARQVADPDNPPVAVALHRYWADIPAPTQSTSGPVGELPLERQTFYETKLTGGALD